MAASNLATGQIRLHEAKLREQSRSAAAADGSKAAVQDPDDFPQEEHALHKRLRNKQPADHDVQTGLHIGVRPPLAALSPSNLNTGRSSAARHAFVAPGGGFDVNSVYSSDENAGRGARASGAPAPGEFEPGAPAPGAPAPAPAPGAVVVRPGASTHSSIRTSKEIEQQDAEWKKLISALKEVPKEDRNNKKLVVTLLGMISLARLHRGSCV